MYRYICLVCNYEFDQAIGDPNGGIAPGTKFEDVPHGWVCPVCGVHIIEMTNTRFDKHAVNELK